MLALIGMVVAAALGPVSPASAAGGEVIVEYADNSIPVHLGDLGPPDIPDSSYKLNDGWVVQGGHSLRAVLEAVGRNEGFELVSLMSVVVDAKPGTREITRAQFDNGPPIFFEKEGGTSWILPGSAGRPGELFAFADSAPVIRVRAGRQFTVELSSSPEKARAGAEVRLKATVRGQPAGEELAFTWRFGDGKVLQEGSGDIAHKFETSGTFEVYLEVTGPSGGGSARAVVQVGKAKPKKVRREKEPPGRKKKGRDDPGKKDDDRDNQGGSGPGGGGVGAGNGSGAGDRPGAGPGATGPAPSADRSASGPKDGEQHPKGRQQSDRDRLDEVRGVLVDPGGFTAAPAATPPSDTGADRGGAGVGGPASAGMGILALLLLGGSAERLLFRRELS